MESTGKVAVVAGGTGLIGSSLISLLVNDGFRVKLLTRYPSKVKHPHAGVDVVEWTGKTDSGLRALLENTTVLINLTGYNIATIWTKGNKKRIVDSRLLTTRALAKAIAQCSVPPKVFIQASAVGFYPYNSSVVLTEQSPGGKGFLAELVGEWENEALNCSTHTRLILARTGIVLAANGGFLPKIARPIRYFLGAIPGSGKNIIPWIHIADHVRAIKFLIDNPAASGAFNLTSPASNTHADIARIVANYYRRPILLHIPSVLLRLLPGNMANEVILANQPVQPQRLIQLGFKWNFPKLDLAIADLLAE